MNIFKKVLLVGAIVLASAGANAELVNSDWSTSGDGSSVYDDVSGLTWLDLTVTEGMSYSDAGDVIGVRYATWTELDTMVNSYFGHQLNNIGDPTEVNISLVANWMNLFGSTTQDGLQSNGYITRDNGTISDFQILNVTDYAHIWQANDDMFVSGTTPFATYLIVEPSGSNTNEPLPASLGLLTLAMIGFSARRKSK